MYWFQNICLSIVVLLLSLVPLPSYLLYFWPCFVVLFFFKINVYQLRTSVNIWAWIMGLSLDLLQHTYLGFHVLALLCLNYFISQYRHKFLLSPMAQQILFVMFGTMIYSCFNEAFDWKGNGYQFALRILILVLVTAIQWPWINIWHRQKRMAVTHYRKLI
jgi:rod shape-determining protein MreD